MNSLNNLQSPIGKLIGLVLVSLVLGACSGNNSGSTGNEQFREAPYGALYAAGIDRYLGSFTPSSATVAGNETVHEFGLGGGPECLRGTEYRMSTRDQGSSDLLIMLNGGGGCWSTLCAANETAGEGVPSRGVLDTSDPLNPMRDWNAAFFPYCDGSLFTGDAERDYTNDGTPEIHRGLQNLSAGLDVTANAFPAPSRIVLSGTSGGGYGTVFALPLLRKLYPDTPIIVINDSGVGQSRPGTGEVNDLLISDWNSQAFFPEGLCGDSCYDDGTLRRYFNYQLSEDSNFRLNLMSTKQDAVISGGFLGISGAEFESGLLPYMAAVEADNPDRVRTFVADGNQHTFLQGDLSRTAGGVSVYDWVRAAISGNANWQSTQD